MNTNNALLTLTTAALVFAGAATAANSDNLHNISVLNSEVQQVMTVKTSALNNRPCTLGDPRPECRDDDDCVCIAA